MYDNHWLKDQLYMIFLPRYVVLVTCPYIEYTLHQTATFPHNLSYNKVCLSQTPTTEIEKQAVCLWSVSTIISSCKFNKEKRNLKERIMHQYFMIPNSEHS